MRSESKKLSVIVKDRVKPAPSSASVALEAWLAANEVGDKDAVSGCAEETRRSRSGRDLDSRRLTQLRPQAVLDLHGMTGEEAESAIAGFIEESSRGGLEKVLIIHGKGLHSAGLPVLKRAARRALENHPSAGRFGEAEKADGGSGALWVFIRGRR
jgi:DNA-nicking Smr family endonuclease